ncbi:MAG: hypothetical protein ABJR46_16630 [Tateyamaria sp.]|uniref:hypothetical protein n=1 Tax=Tateyamaria sp. TaxID=1929288 RepID=UPI00329CB322
MTRFFPPLLGTSALGLTAAAMTSLAWQQLNQTADYSVPKERTVSRDSAELAGRTTSLTVRPNIYYSATTERPLFLQSRRPTELEQLEKEVILETPTKQLEPDAPPPAVALHGVSGSINDLRALLSIEGDAPDWFLTDAKIQQWVLVEIGADWVVLQRNEISFRVELYKQ